MENNIVKKDNNTETLMKMIMRWLKTTTHFDDIQCEQCLMLAKANKLNPLKREIYFSPRKQRDGSITIQATTSFEVYLAKAQETGNFMGYETTFFNKNRQVINPIDEICDAVEIKIYNREWKVPLKMWGTMEMWKPSFNSDFWLGKKGNYMLEKVVLSQGLRRCFAQLSNLPYSNEEASIYTKKIYNYDMENKKLKQEIENTEFDEQLNKEIEGKKIELTDDEKQEMEKIIKENK